MGFPHGGVESPGRQIAIPISVHAPSRSETSFATRCASGGSGEALFRSIDRGEATRGSDRKGSPTTLSPPSLEDGRAPSFEVSPPAVIGPRELTIRG